MQLPSAFTVTIASEVVGETHALNPIAMPRPFSLCPLPRSKGCPPSRSEAVRSRTFSIAASRITVPVACGRPSRRRFLRRNSTGSDAELARHHVGVAFVRPHELRDAEAAQRPAGTRFVYSA